MWTAENISLLSEPTFEIELLLHVLVSDMQGLDKNSQFLMLDAYDIDIFYRSLGCKGKDSVPKMVNMYMKKELMVDEFISHRFNLEQVNEAFDLMRQGKR